LTPLPQELAPDTVQTKKELIAMTTRTLDGRNGSAQIIPIVAIAAGVVLAATVAFVAIGGGNGNNNGGVGAPPAGDPSPTPIVTPAPAPSDPADPPAPAPSDPADPADPADPEPTDSPSEDPSDGGTDGMPIKVDLDNETGADVYVDIVDGTGYLVGAESGTPGEGTSVDLYTLQVENIDAKTLKLTWIDYPIDNALALYIDETEGGIRLLLVQPEPTGPTDSMGLDRELILSFSQPISADNVEAFLQDGLDTPG
jgi:hypothetical protein